MTIEEAIRILGQIDAPIEDPLAKERILRQVVSSPDYVEIGQASQQILAEPANTASPPWRPPRALMIVTAGGVLALVILGVLPWLTGGSGFASRIPPDGAEAESATITPGSAQTSLVTVLPGGRVLTVSYPSTAGDLVTTNSRWHGELDGAVQRDLRITSSSINEVLQENRASLVEEYDDSAAFYRFSTGRYFVVFDLGEWTGLLYDYDPGAPAAMTPAQRTAWVAALNFQTMEGHIVVTSTDDRLKPIRPDSTVLTFEAGSIQLTGGCGGQPASSESLWCDGSNDIRVEFFGDTSFVDDMDMAFQVEQTSP